MRKFRVCKSLWGLNLNRNDFTFGVAPSNIENCVMIINNLKRKYRKLSEFNVLCCLSEINKARRNCSVKKQ